MVSYIELLEARHRHETFDCGDLPLSDFLRRQTVKQHRHGLGKTYVMLADNGSDVTDFVAVSDGRDLLALVLRLALELSERVGLSAAVVDVKDAQAAKLYRCLPFLPTQDSALRLFLPLSMLAKARAGQ